MVGERSARRSAWSGPATEESLLGVRRLFESIARRGPLVVVIDDLHWAETTLLDLIEDVVARARDAPIMMLCLARPDLLEARPIGRRCPSTA